MGDVVTLPGLPQGTPPQPEVVHVSYDIVHVPVVRLRPCECGRDHMTPADEVLKLARGSKDLPPMQCSCGRVVVGRKRLIEVAGAIQ